MTLFSLSPHACFLDIVHYTCVTEQLSTMYGSSSLLSLRSWINFQSAIFVIFSSLFKQLLFSFLVQEMSFDIMDFCPVLHKQWQHWFGEKHGAFGLCLPRHVLPLPFTNVLNHQDRINVSFSFDFREFITKKIFVLLLQDNFFFFFFASLKLE